MIETDMTSYLTNPTHCLDVEERVTKSARDSGRWRERYRLSPSLQAEFGDVETYLAFMKVEGSRDEPEPEPTDLTRQFEGSRDEPKVTAPIAVRTEATVAPSPTAAAAPARGYDTWTPAEKAAHRRDVFARLATLKAPKLAQNLMHVGAARLPVAGRCLNKPAEPTRCRLPTLTRGFSGESAQGVLPAHLSLLSQPRRTLCQNEEQGHAQTKGVDAGAPARHSWQVD